MPLVGFRFLAVSRGPSLSSLFIKSTGVNSLPYRWQRPPSFLTRQPPITHPRVSSLSAIPSLRGFVSVSHTPPICHTRPFVPICHTPHFSLGGSSYGLESAKWSKLPALLKSQMRPLFTDPPLVLAIAGDQTQHVLWRLHHGELPGISLILPGLRYLVDPHRHRALTPPPSVPPPPFVHPAPMVFPSSRDDAQRPSADDRSSHRHEQCPARL